MFKSISIYREYSLKFATITKIIIEGLLLIGIALLIASCEQPLPEADFPHAVFYADKCGACHTAPHPQAHTFKAWKKIVPKMEKRVEATGIRPILSEEDMTDIFSYLKKHARNMF
jgi:hypothetical protein